MLNEKQLQSLQSAYSSHNRLDDVMKTYAALLAEFGDLWQSFRPLHGKMVGDIPSDQYEKIYNDHQRALAIIEELDLLKRSITYNLDIMNNAASIFATTQMLMSKKKRDIQATLDAFKVTVIEEDTIEDKVAAHTERLSALKSDPMLLNKSPRIAIEYIVRTPVLLDELNALDDSRINREALKNLFESTLIATLKEDLKRCHGITI